MASPYLHYNPDQVSSSYMGQTLQPVFVVLSYGLAQAEKGFNAVPGSAVLLRYIRESHRDDPGRTALEVLLIIFALWTVVQGRRRAGREAKSFVKLSEKEVDDLVDDWQPEPLVPALSPEAFQSLSKTPIIVGPNGPRPRVTNSVIDSSLALSASHPNVDPAILSSVKSKEVINLASYNFTSLPPASTSRSSSPKAGVEPLPGTETAINTLRKYGLGSCGPPGFYGTIDVHLELEQTIASFLGTEASIIYSQSFSTASSVIPAFCKRGDVIVADRGVNFIIQRGLHLSRSTVRWYDHNSLRANSGPSSLIAVLEGLEKEFKRKKTPLTRRFIVTEGLFSDTGSLTDLPVLLSIAKKYKYRIILDESLSIGTLGRTGRGLTELYNVPAEEVDMIIGSMANTMGSSGGFCAGTKVMCEHQRINSTALVFSAALPALLATQATERIGEFVRYPEMFALLQENVGAIRATLAGVETMEILSHSVSPLIHLAIKVPTATSLSVDMARSGSAKPNNANSIMGREPVTFDVAREEVILQDVVDECLLQGVLVTRPQRLWGEDEKQPLGQEWHPIRPTIRLAASSALTKKESVKAATVVRNAWVKVISRRR